MPRPSDQWPKGQPRNTRQPEAEIHFYGIYLIVGLSLSIFLFVCLVRTLHRRSRREDILDPAFDDLDLEASGHSADADRPDMTNYGTEHYLWWNDGPGSFIATTPNYAQPRSQCIPDRPRDDPYEAAVASLISLEAQHDSSSREPYFLQYRVRDLRKFQRLVEKLRNASYLSERENNNPARQREVENIRMQIAHLVVGPESHHDSVRPRLHIYTEPPPAYRDVESSPPPPLSPLQD